MDLTLYWFMFPVSILVATTAMLTGIGGAAYFVPIFWIIFPFLGPEYVIGDAQVIAVALFTEVFGFSSGFVGYYRKKLIDFKIGRAFFLYSVVAAVVGAIILIAGWIASAYLQLIYAVMMLFVAYLLYSGAEDTSTPLSTGDNSIPATAIGDKHRTVDNLANIYTYRFHTPRGVGGLVLAFGGFLTGLVGVGIGEVTIPLLVRRYRIPVAVAAATSILVVIVTVMSASFAQFIGLMTADRGGVPWHLIMYTVPAVVIGGQIGPRLQGVIPARTVERIIATLFVVIAIAFFILVYRALHGQ